MKGSYAIVSILAYFHPLQISLSILGIVHFLSGGGGQVGFDGRRGGGGRGQEKHGFKEGERQEKNITYWV